jgi:hypothetical protein
MNSNNVQPKKVLFCVFSEGRKVEGEFSNKMEAKRFRDSSNAKRKAGARAWWVGLGKDHSGFRAVSDEPRTYIQSESDVSIGQLAA